MAVPRDMWTRGIWKDNMSKTTCTYWKFVKIFIPFLFATQGVSFRYSQSTWLLLLLYWSLFDSINFVFLNIFLLLCTMSYKKKFKTWKTLQTAIEMNSQNTRHHFHSSSLSQSKATRVYVLQSFFQSHRYSSGKGCLSFQWWWWWLKKYSVLQHDSPPTSLRWWPNSTAHTLSICTVPVHKISEPTATG